MPSVVNAPPGLKSRNMKKEKTEQGFDDRHPLYLGDWERSVPYVDEDFAVDDLDEPHIKRKHAILEKHPEITKLYGDEPSTKWISLGCVGVQMFFAFMFGRVWNEANIAMLVVSYIVGGLVTQNLGIVIHEATHNLVAKSTFMNRVHGLIANIGIPFPIAMSFRRYHLEHHAYQGVFGKDPDLPLAWEVKLIKGNPFLKFLFVFFFPMLYVIRGAAQQKTPTKWELINWLFTISSDYLVYQTCGLRGLLYLTLSLWFGYGIHPAAGHFIQEHYTFVDGQETYSYYGSFNNVTMNIGYHNEHHDFTKVTK